MSASHRPQTFEQIRLAVREMSAAGFSVYTIAQAVGVSVVQVRGLLREVERAELRPRRA